MVIQSSAAAPQQLAVIVLDPAYTIQAHVPDDYHNLNLQTVFQ
jgi:hypothetical protein